MLCDCVAKRKMKKERRTREEQQICSCSEDCESELSGENASCLEVYSGEKMRDHTKRGIGEITERNNRERSQIREITKITEIRDQ